MSTSRLSYSYAYPNINTPYLSYGGLKTNGSDRYHISPWNPDLYTLFNTTTFLTGASVTLSAPAYHLNHPSALELHPIDRKP